MKRYIAVIAASALALVLLLILPQTQKIDIKPVYDPPKTEDITSEKEDITAISGKYLGLEDQENITLDDIKDETKAIYLFLSEGKKKAYKIKCDDALSIQNELIIGKEYTLSLIGDTIVSLKRDIPILPDILVPEFGERTVINLIKTAFAPMGKTLYIYGGGWNLQDDGAGVAAMTLGLSADWKNFYLSQNADYDLEKYMPQNGLNHHNREGLDCSGYMGWVLYNALYCEENKDVGYVVPSKKFAQALEEYCLGTCQSFDGTHKAADFVKALRPGDIVSINGHVYIVLDVCDDQSVIVIHSTASDSVSGAYGGGVQISAINTKTNLSKKCKAYDICRDFCDKYFEDFVSRYPVTMKDTNTYFGIGKDKGAFVFHWELDKTGLRDDENVSQMSAEMLFERLEKIINEP
ncbi:MAG: hypothetical protein J5922_05095 [Clostridia bacterium]|nr:hypothetical protein [Clostridia bacterium]